MPAAVFISYSRDSDAHARRVLALADELRDEGIDVRLDQYVSHPSEGWPRWRERQLVESDFVLMICTPTYRQHFERKKGPSTDGTVAWEALLAEQLMVDAGARNEKLIPVLFDDGTEQDVPLPLRAFCCYCVPEQYDDLYRRLTGQPRTPAPPLGDVRPMPPQPRPSFLERSRFDFRGATIGKQVLVAGSASMGPTTIVMPSPSSVSPTVSPAPTVDSAAPADSRPEVAAEPMTILLCTTNAIHPRQQLQLEEETRVLEDALTRSQSKERFAVRVSGATTLAGLIREFDDHGPAFVHFSGPSDGSGALVFREHPETTIRIPPARVADLLDALQRRPALVVFAMCRSGELAEAAALHAEFTIGFTGDVEHHSAQSFSAMLYERLASQSRMDVKRAFRLARLACRAAGHHSMDHARLFERSMAG